MTRTEQHRAMIPTKLLVGELTSAEAAELRALSTRTVRSVVTRASL